MNKNKILILGNGYLGSAFKARGCHVLNSTEFRLVPDNLKVRNENLTELLFKTQPYNVIVNCIAKSNTRYCETNFREALFTNGIVPEAISMACKISGKKFVHISTGCLYDDNKTPQKETDFLVAHCGYTVTKWAGEKGCDPSQDLILRPRLFFDASDRPANLLNKIQKFEKLHEDQDSMSSIDVVVDAALALISNECSGVFNVACEGTISAREMGSLIGIDKPVITMDQIRKEQGLYLVNNIMDITKLKQFYTPPNIKDEIKRVNALRINENIKVKDPTPEASVKMATQQRVESLFESTSQNPVYLEPGDIK